MTKLQECESLVFSKSLGYNNASKNISYRIIDFFYNKSTYYNFWSILVLIAYASNIWIVVFKGWTDNKVNIWKSWNPSYRVVNLQEEIIPMPDIVTFSLPLILGENN